jgi:sugar phosphate permease
VTLIVLGGSTQVFFLPAILPQVLPDLGVAPEDRLEAGGILIFVSGVAAALGALATPRLAELVVERRLIRGLLLGSSICLALLGAAGSAWLYGALRFLQVLSIAPVFPLVVARVAQRAGGQTIGVINSARIGAAFLGPVAATTALAWTSPGAVYVLLALVGLACLPLTLRRPGERPA